MAKKKISHEFEKIQDESPTYARIEEGVVKNSLGAVADAATGDLHGSPFAIWVLRNKLLHELVSSGGRPGRKDAVLQKKIPMTEVEWNVLDQVTEMFRTAGVRATPGQVAGILLRQSMAEVLVHLSRFTPVTGFEASELAKLEDDDLERTVEKVLAAAASAELHLEQLRPVALEMLKRMRASKGVKGEVGQE